MTEGPQHGTRRSDDSPVDALASRALSLVARKTPRVVIPLFVELLHDAALAGGGSQFQPVVERMGGAGISPEEIADLYVPAVARRMGDLWWDDLIGFASVTIGVSRLQGLLRELGPEWRADSAGNPDAPALLVIVGHDVYHTLGATVLTGQLRRMGYSVRLGIGLRPDEVGPLIRQIRFDAVLISSSSGESLEMLRRLVDGVKTAIGKAPPVVIGGTITQTGDDSGADIRALTGADFVTNDLSEALKLCGMTISTRSVAPSGRRT